MSHARFIIGDTRDVVEAMPDGSIDLVLTSPPFLALRSYLPADHPDKWREIGSEPTPADFLDTLLDLTVLWRRKLAPHGSIAIELGDTYSDYAEGGMRDGQPKAKGSGWHRLGVRAKQADQPPNYRKAGTESTSGSQSGGRGWPMAKSLCGIPHLYHLSLAYGRNMLRPEHTIEPWRVRNVVAWCRPNPPVGALGDKFRPGTSYLTIATVARDRYFDLDAVREVGTEPGAVKKKSKNNSGANTRTGWTSDNAEIHQNPAGAPPLDWWEIPTEPYEGSHYATWPRKLLTRPILSMCPQRVCTTCGEPSRRIVESDRPAGGAPGRLNDARPGGVRLSAGGAETQTTYVTLGWSDCGHDTWRNGLVLDPFAGSGTTLAVATGLGRDAIGIDIDDRNADLARERVGMFLDVEHHQPAAATA